MPRTVYSYPERPAHQSLLKRTDAEYWRMLDFAFLEGGPVHRPGRRRTARSSRSSTPPRATGSSAARPAVGRTIEADGQHFRVIGVVPDVPILRLVANGDIYVPVTTAKTDAYRTELLGGFGGLLLARSPADFPAIKAELETRVRGRPRCRTSTGSALSPRPRRSSSQSPASCSAAATKSAAIPNALWAVLIARRCCSSRCCRR